MKSASAAFKTMLASGVELVQADLWTITLVDATVIRWTGAQRNLTVGGNDFAAGPPITRGKVTWQVGTGADQMEMSIFDDGSNLIEGSPIVVAAREGKLDGATILLEQFVSTSWTDMSAGSVHYFQGTVGEVKVALGRVDITVEPPLAELQANWPRNYVLPSCANTLYDSVCGVNRATYTEHLTVGAGPTANVIPTGSAKADGYYSLGKITFTSGALTGITRSIKTYAGGSASLVWPLPAVPAVGDSFDIIAGCDKTRTTCTNRFANLTHFRGCPYVPNPSTLYAGDGVSAPTGGTGAGQGSAPGGGGSSLGSASRVRPA